MNIWYTEDDKTQYNNLCTTENTIIFSLSLKQNVSFPLPSNQNNDLIFCINSIKFMKST